LEKIFLSQEVIKNVTKITFTELPNLKLIGFDLKFGDEVKGIEIIKLKNLPELKTFLVNNCKIEKIKIENCPELVEFRAGNNYLSNLDFLLESDHKDGEAKFKNLSVLSVHSNHFIEQIPLSFFSKFKNLESLFIDNLRGDEKNNQFYGSFSGLEDLTELKELSIINNIEINNENIDSLNSLSNLESVTFSTDSDEILKNTKERVDKVERV